MAKYSIILVAMTIGIKTERAKVKNIIVELTEIT